MDNTDHILEMQGKQMDTISFKELIEKITGIPFSFEKIDTDLLIHGEKNVERENNVE